MTTATDIRRQAQAVLEARTEAARAKEALDQAKRKWEEENAALIAEARCCADRQAEAEAELRAMAASHFLKTGDKAPGPGVAIRVSKCLYYDPKLAYDWASQHHMFLSLDAKAFERFVKAGGADQVPFVQIVEEASATIATDLAKALAS